MFQVPSKQRKEDMIDELFLFFVLGKVRGNRAFKVRIKISSVQEIPYRPLGSVCFDHAGVQRVTVDAH